MAIAHLQREQPTFECVPDHGRANSGEEGLVESKVASNLSTSVVVFNRSTAHGKKLQSNVTFDYCIDAPTSRQETSVL